MNLDSHADPEADHDRVFEDTDSSSASSVHEEPVIQHVADPARLGVAAAAGAVQKFFQSRGGLQFGSSHVFYSETGGPYVVNPSTHTAVEQQQQHQPPQYSTSDMLSMMQLPPPPPGPPLLSVERGAVHSGAAGTASVDLLNVFEVPVAKKKGSRRRSTKKHVPRTDSKKTLKEGRGQEVVDVNEELFIPHSPPFSPDAAVIQGGSDDAIPNEPPSDDHSEYELHMGEAEVAEGGAVGEEVAQKEALGALVDRLADGSIPPLRAHLYYEEEHGAFNDHIAHAALEKKLAEEAAVRAWLDQDREKEARRWARYQRALMSYGSSTQGGMRGEPRWSSIEDAATYRASMQHATLYMQHLSHYLAAFAAGAALLTLIATTLPPYEASQSGLGLVVGGGGGDDCVDSSGSSNNARAHKDDDNTLRVDSIAVVVLVLRRFDAPLFLFLSIMLILTTLVTFPWGLAESKWRDKKRSVAQLMQAEGGGGAAAGKRSGAGSATAYMAQRRAQFGDEYAQRQRLRNGDTSMVDISTTAGASGSGTSTAVSPASATAATTVDEYGVNPRVAMQLNEYVYQKQQQQHQQQYGGMDSALATMRPTLFSTMGYRGEASSPTLFSDGPLGFSQSMLNTSDSRAGMWQQPQQRGSGGHTPEVGNSITAMNTTGGYNMNTSASAFWASRRMNRASMNRASMSHGSMNSKGLGGIPSDHQQFDDTFYVVPEMDGSSNIIPTNPISRSFRMARLWLARKVLGSYYVEQVDVLMQPRLWCILVCFAVTVAELAFLQDRTTLDLLRSLSPDTVTTADGTASSESGAYRNTLLATYIIRATMLLLVWVLDMFL